MNRILFFVMLISFTGCSSFDLGTLYSLSKLEPTDIDPVNGRVAILWPSGITHYRPPTITYEGLIKGKTIVEGEVQISTDFEAERFVPYNRSAGGEMIVYSLDSKDHMRAFEIQKIALKESNPSAWTLNTHTNFSFTIEEDLFRAYCEKKQDLDVSMWVKVSKNSTYQRLVDDKAIDRFIGGQIKDECKKSETNFITRQ